MKKTLTAGLLMLSCVLCGCSNGGTTAQTKGTVDGYSIRVTNGGSSIFSGTYNASYSRVYEYKNSIGDSIYTNYRIVCYNYDTGVPNDAVIYSYKDRYTNEYVEYSYVGFIGWLTVENNYYLNLDDRIIDSETKWSEYLYSSNPSEDKADNKKAYQCAQKNYYQVSTKGYNDANGKSFYPLKMDITEKTLERHSYTKLGEDCVITYTAKWF